MTPRQALWRVEVPLAAPVAMAGVRTAAVLTIGTATLATPVGQTSLGDYIFSGLQTEDWVLVLFGCVAAAVLALAVDQLLGLIETGLARGDRRRVGVGLGGLIVGLALALAPLAFAGGKAAYVIGAKNFSEQYILAELMASRLEAAGAKVARKNDLGSAIAFQALASGGIDAYVDYSGTLWTNVLKRKGVPSRAALLAELTRQLKAKYGVTVLGPLGFENAYALAMKQTEAERLNIKSLDDLSRQAGQLTLGADIEFLSRPEWGSVQGAYGLRFKAERKFQPTFMYRALASGEADVISAFSSDGRIAADKLVTLADPRQAIPPYDAVILLAPGRERDARLVNALKPLLNRLDVEKMRAANYAVDREADKQNPAQAARALAASLGMTRH